MCKDEWENTQIKLITVADANCPYEISLTAPIDSQGGSYELICLLNHLGAVASVETHRRYVQFQLEKKLASGILQSMDLSSFTVASVDNIDFLQQHAAVYCGDQSRSWHGTTVQVVQPLTQDTHRSAPTTEEAMDCSRQGQGGQDTCTTNEETDNSESSLLHQKRPDRPTPDSSSSKTTQSPQHKKIMRRSRSFT